MENPTDKLVHVGSNVILEQDGKVLLGRRLKKAGYMLYGVPGGHLEFGESLEGCAKRELEEETGLIADELEFVSCINQPRSTSPEHYIQFVFVCRKFHGTLTNVEPMKCAGWEWFDIHNIPGDIFPAHKDFIPAYLEKKAFIDSK